MILSHFSREPLSKAQLTPRAQAEEAWLKPSGLWVSVDGEDDWPEWCKANDFDGVGPHHYRVHLYPKVMQSGRMLLLDTEEKVRGFSRRWTIKLPESPITHIDWAAVAKRYNGIIITPYQWNLRCEPGFLWYYGWDCASGCIWNPHVIERMELLK